MILKNVVGEEYDCNIVSEEDLPSGCGFVDHCEDDNCNSYEVYKSCVDFMYYAVKED